MNCKEIGTQISRQEFVDFLNSVKGGQFFHILGYVNSDGEKSDQWLRFGIKYDSLRKRDIGFLNSALSGNTTFSIQVNHGVWIPDNLVSSICDSGDVMNDNSVRAKATAQIFHNGKSINVEAEGWVDLLDTVKFNNRKSSTRVPVMLSYELPSNHPLVIAAIGEEDLQGTILQGLTNPKPATTEYDHQAQSCYSLEQHEKHGTPVKWYLRDVLAVHKVVRVFGQKSFKASLPINAVKDAIRSQLLLTGKYRQFVLTDGQFESITIQGQAIMCDGVDEEFYFALPEHVKKNAVVQNESVNPLIR